MTPDVIRNIGWPPIVKRPLQTIDRSGRLTTVTLPILTRSRPRLSCVRFRL